MKRQSKYNCNKEEYNRIFALGWMAGRRFERKCTPVIQPALRKSNTKYILPIFCFFLGVLSYWCGKTHGQILTQENLIKEYLYQEYKGQAGGLTDKMNFFGYQEDILELEFLKRDREGKK